MNGPMNMNINTKNGNIDQLLAKYAISVLYNVPVSSCCLGWLYRLCLWLLIMLVGYWNGSNYSYWSISL